MVLEKVARAWRWRQCGWRLVPWEFKRGMLVLFDGDDNVGKTDAAESLASMLRMELCHVDLAAVVNKYIGETEKHLDSIFKKAEKSGVLLFFDEADALFGKRTNLRDGNDRYANAISNDLLQRMEDYSGIAILATNLKADPESSFVRRAHYRLDFPLVRSRYP